MKSYTSKRIVTLEADFADSPEQALSHVTSEARGILGEHASVTNCEIIRSCDIGNSWKIIATFEIPS